MHKRDDDVLSKKERLTYFDQGETAIVPLVLSEDPEFQSKSRHIAGKPPRDRRAAAELLAKDYAPNKSAAQRRVVELFLLMAEELWRERGIPRRLFFENLTQRAVWVDAPLDELDGRRGRERRAMLREGARSFARFGAGMCMHCGTRLARDRYNRCPRPTHCGRCCSRMTINSELLAKRKALDAWTGQRRHSRAARRLN
jgi:hypothetical protein